MHIVYNCAHCKQFIAEIDATGLNEVQLGFDCLTPEERQDIIKINPNSGIVFVAAICDSCMEEFEGTQEKLSVFPLPFIH